MAGSLISWELARLAIMPEVIRCASQDPGNYVQPDEEQGLDMSQGGVEVDERS